MNGFEQAGLRKMESDSPSAVLARSDPNDVFDGGNKDLPIANLARTGGLKNRINDAFGGGVIDDDFELKLRQEVHDVFGAAVDFCVTFLSAKPLHL